MKNLKKFLAVFLSIAMVMCSALPSFASETETTVGASEEIVESSEETRMGEFDEPEEEPEEDESSMGEFDEPEEETSTGEFDEPEEDETSIGEFDEPEETVEASEDFVGASSTSPEDESEQEEVSEPEDEIESEEDEVDESEEIVESSEAVGPASPSELTEISAKVDDKLLGDTVTPWMYWWLTDGDKTIHYQSYDPGGVGAKPITGTDAISYDGLDYLVKTYITKAVFENEIEAETCEVLFDDFSRLETIEQIENLKTSKVTNMRGMFSGCEQLTNLDVTGFNTSEVTSMRFMFGGCRGIKSLNLNNFNTSNVTDMLGMFSKCSSLLSLDLSKFVTNKVKHMTSMFDECSNLTELDLKSFEVDNVISMSSMFEDCVKLKKLDITSFTPNKVMSFDHFLSSCQELDSIDLSGLDTSSAENMNQMFWWCSGLHSLDLSSFNTENVTEMDQMFYECSSLEKIIVSSKFNTLNVTSSNDMFANCANLVGGAGTTYDGGHIDNEYARIDGGTAAPGYFTDVNWMYWYLTDEDGDSTSETIHFTSINQGAAIGINCGPNDEIEYVGLGKDNITKAVFDNEINAVTCKRFFYNFTHLTNIENLNKLETGNVTTMNEMFRQTEVSDLDLKNFDTSKVRDMSFMFCQNNALKELNLRSFDTSNVERMTYMFTNCTAIEKILVSSSFVIVGRLADNGTEMFTGCANLVGGAGTTYKNSNPKDQTYARIDEGTAAPGYFTLYVPPTPPAPYYPGGRSSSGSSGGGGGGGGGGGPVTEDAPAVTYLPYVKSIIAFASNHTSKWSQDAMSSKWKLSVTGENGSETNLKNGFVLYTHISTQIVGNETVQTAANNTYVFDENGNMITGWVHTSDGKTYFFENKKGNDEGKMIIGWKQIQGSWYYFGADGTMYIDTVTPDGHPVGPDGKWRG